MKFLTALALVLLAGCAYDPAARIINARESTCPDGMYEKAPGVCDAGLRLPTR